MDVADRLSTLTPEQRAAFELLRKKKLEKKKRKPPEPPPLMTAPEAEVYPLSLDQERLWFLWHLDKTSNSYNIDVAARLEGHLDLQVIQRCYDTIIERHEIWRTTFPSIDGKPVQKIGEPWSPTIAVVDMTRLSGELGYNELATYALRAAADPFDLENGPLMRAMLLRMAPQDHICMMTVHHIVNDWYSYHNFWAELTALYDAYIDGKPSPLPPVPVRYVDFSHWQREWMQEDVVARFVEHWVEQLEGFPHVLDLPTDHPRPVYYVNDGHKVPIDFAKEKVDGLKALSGEETASLFQTVIALYGCVLCRYAAQERLLISSPSANRRFKELEPMLGFFLTQFLFPVDLSRGASFREVLRRLRKHSVESYPYADVPFSQLLEAMQVERDTSRLPLAQVTIHLLNDAYTKRSLRDLTLTSFPLDDEGARFEMTLAFWLMNDGHFKGFWEYNRSLFDGVTARRLTDAYRLLVDSVLEDPDRPLWQVPVLTPACRHQVLREFNTPLFVGASGAGSPAAAFSDTSLVQLLRQQVEARPDAATVLRADGSELTYGELWAQIQRLARHLRARGVGPEVRVGLGVDRSPEMLLSMLAVHLAGGAYVPLDPTFPPERLAYMLDDAGSRLLLATRGLSAAFQVPDSVEVAEVETLLAEEVLSEEPVSAASDLPDPDPAGLAYVIYTSGSTGKPKGVQIPHGALANFLQSMQRRPGLGPDDLLLAVTTISFDISGLELYLPLVSGGRVRIVERDIAADGLRLAELIGSTNAAGMLATAMQATPATWRLLLDAGWGGPVEGQHLKILCGGEALPTELADRLLTLGAGAPGSVELWNVYGPTETTIWSTVRRVAQAATEADEGEIRSDVGEHPIVPLGRPIANTAVYILGDQLQPVALGTYGHLYIAGDGLARGYLGRPGLTASVFQPDPYAETAGARMYRTGDVARHLPDGDLDFRGRSDFQVKVRGFRIELGEIEARLLDLPSISSAVVMARESPAGGHQLVAYVIGDSGTVDEDAIRMELRRGLPEYMVPAVFVTLEEFPMTPNGKVDRKALPDPRFGDGTRVAPEGEREETLAAIWQDVLRLEEVGAYDNFFKLGGDSILSIQVITRARDKGMHLEPGWFFQYQTLRELASVAISTSEVESVEIDEDEDFGWSDDDFAAISDAIEDSMD